MEGVDIASLDMVMFLRPTESPIVFLQQLGRGLRTYKGKLISMFWILSETMKKRENRQCYFPMKNHSSTKKAYEYNDIELS